MENKLKELAMRILKLHDNMFLDQANDIQIDINISGMDLLPIIEYRLSLPAFQFRSDWNSNVFNLIHQANLFLDSKE